MEKQEKALEVIDEDGKVKNFIRDIRKHWTADAMQKYNDWLKLSLSKIL